MSDDGDTKDDVKVPDGEVGEKINKLYRVEEKDTSMFSLIPYIPPKRRHTPILILTLPDVTILTAMGEESAIDAKEAPRQ